MTPVITDAPRRVIEAANRLIDHISNYAPSVGEDDDEEVIVKLGELRELKRALAILPSPSPSERREVIAPLADLVTACIIDFGTPDENDGDDEPVATELNEGTVGNSAVTFGILRRALEALAKADAILSLGLAAPAPAPVSLGSDDETPEERALGEVIDQRDAADGALSQAFYLVTGRPPQWSNLFGHAEALDEIGEALSLLRHVAFAPPGAAGLKEGFVLVPREPDVNMIAAFWRQKNTGSQEPSETSDATDDYSAYRAMIAAAPSPDQPSEEIEN